MAKSKIKGPPSAKSLKEIVEFFDAHDMGAYWDQMPKARFDINLQRRTHLIAIDEDLFGKLTEIAKSKKVSSKTLIDSWLKEKIRKVG
jgi:hypothetical protein